MINGVLIVNKEKDFTSFDVVAKLRGIVGQKKVGHTGTLDPDATGVLVCLLGNATKLSELLTSDTKRYSLSMRLGLSSDTDDISGNVTKGDLSSLEMLEKSERDRLILNTVKSFEKTYMQLPPMYSAIKVNGKKLYEYAREGVSVERTPREVTIYEINNIIIDFPDISFDVFCSKGTYIRSLCRDIGESLSCMALMTELKRNVTGSFDISMAHTLSEIEDFKKNGELEKLIIPTDALISQYTALNVKKEYAKALLNGNKLEIHSFVEKIDYPLKEDMLFRVYLDGTFKALYKPYNNELKPYKMF